MLGAHVRLVGPPTLMPLGAERWGAEVFHDMREGLKDADVVMMLRVQRERMTGGFFPSRARISSGSTASTKRSSASPSPARSSCTPAR